MSDMGWLLLGSILSWFPWFSLGTLVGFSVSETRRQTRTGAGRVKNIEEWADLHGEIPMSRSQAEREEERERQRREERYTQEFTLKLNAAELDWLFFDLMDAMYDDDEQPGYAKKVKTMRDKWWASVDSQGYEVF